MEFSGFRVYRADRFAKTGGRAAFYVDSRLKSRFILSSCSRQTRCVTDYLFVEIMCLTQKIFVGVVYESPSIDELNVLSDIMNIQLQITQT